MVAVLIRRCIHLLRKTERARENPVTLSREVFEAGTSTCEAPHEMMNCVLVWVNDRGKAKGHPIICHWRHGGEGRDVTSALDGDG
jgi:hypothetical protein